jgi:hypothetical protein
MAMLVAKLSKLFSRQAPKDNITDTLRLYKAALVLKCHDHFVETESDPLRTDIEDICDDLDKMGHRALDSFIKKSLDKQMQTLFEKVEFNSDRYFEYHTRSKDSADVVSETVGYCPYISAPSADPTGKGVFMQGNAGAGVIVAVFPGHVHLREYTAQINYVEENLLPDDNFFLMRRNDNTIIDARPQTLAQIEIPYNPFALGHMLNHGTSKEAVGKLAAANVLQLNYDFPNDTLFEGFRFPKKLRPFIPNIYAKEPSIITSDRSAMMRTVIFVSTRPIESGSELLVDYRLKGSQNFPLPAWYPKEDEISPEDENMPGTEKDKSANDNMLDKHFG